MGEKLHRFKKGLREDLQEKCVIDPYTGNPYEDIDILIAALTKYEAAVGAGQRQPKQRRNGQLAATGTPPGQRTQNTGRWTGEATPHTQMQLPIQHNPMQSVRTHTRAEMGCPLGNVGIFARIQVQIAPATVAVSLGMSNGSVQ